MASMAPISLPGLLNDLLQDSRKASTDHGKTSAAPG